MDLVLTPICSTAFGEKVGGYGDHLRDDVNTTVLWWGSPVGAESIAMKDNYCEIDPITVDEFGIPVLRFNYKWSDFEKKQAVHMHDTFEEIFENMGGIVLGKSPVRIKTLKITPGGSSHEVGTTRMGSDPKTSVVNEFERLHDVDNVFVVDAGPFVSQADKNPTWTIMALSWRTSEFIIEELKNKISKSWKEEKSIKAMMLGSLEPDY